MRTIRSSWFRALSSGEFFTRWSWLVTLPFAVTVLGGYNDARSADERVAGFLIALGVHVLIGIMGLVAAAGERAITSRRARTAIVLITLALIASSRPILLAAAADAAGLLLFSGPLGARIATNLLVDTIALSIVATITVSVRSHHAIADRLRSVINALDAQRSSDIADVAALSRIVMKTTRDAVIAALPRAAITPSDPRRGATLLQQFAEEVVRPVSHRLFDETATHYRPAEYEQVPDATALPHVDLRGLVRALHAPARWLTAVGYALLWVPYLLVRVPLPTIGIAVMLAIALGGCGNLVAGTTTERQREHWRLAALAGFSAITGAGIGATVGLVLRLSEVPYSLGELTVVIVASAAIYSAFIVVVALADAGFQRLTAIEKDLAVAVEEASAAAAAAHNRLIVARRRAAHALHSDVQAECAAAARSLQGASALSDDDWRAILARIEHTLEEPRRELQRGGARLTVENVLAAWRFSLEIALTADDAAWTFLDAGPARLELAVDILAEALTNIIRHGDELRARVAVLASPSGGTVSVVIVSPGRISSQPGADGYGLAQLARRASRLTLTQAGSSVVLRAEIS